MSEAPSPPTQGAMWRLRPGWTVETKGAELFVRSDTRRLRVSSVKGIPEDLPTSLQRGISDRSGRSDICALIRRLVREGAMMRADAVNESAPLSSGLAGFWQFTLGHAQVPFARIGNCRVMILGLGGTGSIVLQHLVAAGVRSYLLVDDDRVAPANLERQFIYTASDIGRAKVDAALEYVTGRSKDAQVATHAEHVTDSDQLQHMIAGGLDICIICIDEPPIASFKMVAGTLWNTDPAIGGRMTRPFPAMRRASHFGT